MKHFIYHRTGFLPPSNERRGEGFAYNRLSKAWLFAFVSVIYSLIHSFTHLAYAQLTLGSGVVNSYRVVSAVSGATITLSGTATGAAHTLAAGDRVLLVQMTGNTSANGGKFEFGTVASATGTSVTLTTSTTRAYSPSSEKVQLVWVPYNATSITVPAGGIVAKKWDGTTGGIVAVMTPGRLTLNGTINADGAGFRYADGTNTINGNDIYYGGGGGGGVYSGGGGGGGYGSPGKKAFASGAGWDGNHNSTDGNLNGGMGESTESAPISIPTSGGGGGGAGVGGAGAGGAGGAHSGGGGGGAGYAGGGNGGTAADNGKPGGKGSIGATGDTDGTMGSAGLSTNSSGGGANRYVGGGGGGNTSSNGGPPLTSAIIGKSGTNGGIGGKSGTLGSGQYVEAGDGGGVVPSAYNQYQYCDGSFNCPDTRIWMAGGGQNTTQGGGIVLVTAGTIVANTKTISANGDAGVTLYPTLTSSGGGGGGGGGLLVVHTQAITAGPLTLCAKGGQGGKGLSGDGQHGGGGGGSGGGGLVWVQDPLGGIGNNATGAPPAVANTTFCVDGGAMAVVTSNPKSSSFTGVGGAGGPGSVQANNPCAVFGTCPRGSIGDYVWKDANNNGIQDSGELPVQGVRVQLLSSTGTVLSTDTTDASGLYLFPNLASGTYQVKILTASLPSGCVLSTVQNQGGDDAKDSDFDPTTGLSQTITIDAAGTGIAKDNLTIDGALYSPKGSIGDYVWKDANNNGIQDSGELPVQGVRVQLLQGTTVLATDTTDASGLYLFPNLASGTYQVKILTASLPSGCVLSTMQNQGGDDAKDSDFDPTTGLSQTITIDAAGTGIAKDNLTIDGALYSPVFDLALKKTLAAGQSASVLPGSTVKFTITVYNQGAVDATAIQVTDYIPAGLTLADASWTNVGGKATLNTPIASLAAGASTTRDITFTVNAGFTGSATNVAEISSAKDANGNTLTDVDSTPDSDATNDGTPKNDVTNENGKTGGDEDDSDPEIITVIQCPTTTYQLCGTKTSYTISAPATHTNIKWYRDGVVIAGATTSDYVATQPGSYSFAGQDPATSCRDSLCCPILVTGCFDLALKKNLSIAQAASVVPGSLVKFTITVYNQGFIDATAIQVSDYIPTGLTLNDANWSVSNGVATLNTPIASLAAGASTTRDITFTVNAGFTGTATNVAEISSARDANGNTPTDIDSTPDNNPGNDGTPKNDVTNENGKTGGDEDDSDPEVINVLCIRPVLTVGNVVCSGTTYSVVFYSSVANVTASAGTVGNGIITGIPVGTNVAITATQTTGCVSVETVIAPVSCPTACVLPQLTAGQPICTGTTYSVSFTATPGAAVTTSAGTVGTNVITGIPVGTDVTLTATTDAANGCVSRVTVKTPSSCVDVCENPGISLSGPLCSSGTTYSVNYSLISGATLTSSAGVVSNGSVTGIPMGTSVTLTINVPNCAAKTVVVSSPSACPVFDLALKKMLATGQSASVTPGSSVTFTITVYNQGNVNATNIQVSDYIPTGLTLSDANWSVSNGVATLNTPIAALAAGASTTRDITFVVNAGFTGTATNTAEISSSTGGTDIDSTPDNNPGNDGTPKNDVTNENGKTGGDEDDHDPEVINVVPTPVFDLALTKKLATGQSAAVKPGDKVTFTITVLNQGNVTASQIQLSDYIPTGFVFNAADNAAWTLSGTTATTTLPGTLAAGASTTINIVLQVAANFTGTSVVNKAEISSAKDGSGNSVTDIDSTPDQNPANDAGGKEGSASDDAIGGNGTGTPGGTDPATDEDDADPVLVIVSQCKTPNCVDNSIIIVK